MVKFITKSVCMALIAMLCVGSLNAQMARTKTTGPQDQSVRMSASRNTLHRGVPQVPPAPRGMVNVTLEAHDVWLDGSGYHMLLDATATQYGVGFPSTGNPWTGCPVSSNLYDWATHKIPENATPTCNSHSTFVVDGSVTIQIPAGTYDFCFANLEMPYDYWFPSDLGNIASRQDNYVFEDGKKYHFLAHSIGNNDGITVTITNDDPGETYTITTEVSPVNAGTVTGGGTYPEGANVTLTASANSGYQFSEWNTGETTNQITFTATEDATYTAYFIEVEPGDCDPATNLNVAYTEDCKAELTWSEPTSKGRDIILSEGFESGSTPTGWKFEKTGSGAAWMVVEALQEGEDGPIVVEPHSGNYFVTNLWNGAGPRNAWILSSGFTLTAGAEYTISFWLGLQGYQAERDKFKVCLGNDQTASAMESGAIIYDNPGTSTVATWTQMTFTHTPTSTGTYYLGFHAYSDANMGNDIDLDDIEISGGDTPPSDFLFNIYRDDVLVKGNHDKTTYTDEGFDATEGHTWSVKVVCDGGSESGAISKTMDPCETEGPCDPITGGTAAVVCDEAVITWEAITGAVGYKVSRDGALLETVTEPTYTETGEFEDGVSYTWEIVTVCDEDESDAVEITGVASCVGIPELTNNVSIYPNPTSGTITISALNFAKVEIYNTVGQLMETKTDQSFDVSSYNTGIYFFKVYDAYNNSVTKRVMVAK